MNGVPMCEIGVKMSYWIGKPYHDGFPINCQENMDN